VDWLMRTLIVAQESLGNSAPAAGDQATDAASGSAGGAACGGGDPMLMIWMVVLFALMYFMLIRPQKKQRDAHAKLIQSLKKGDRVATSGGLLGTLVGIMDTTVHIEIADGIKVKVQKQHIAGLQADPATKNDG
jgi:preprotein translocase subunit YajC